VRKQGGARPGPARTQAVGDAQTAHSGQARIEHHEIEAAGNDSGEIERFVAARGAPGRAAQTAKNFCDPETQQFDPLRQEDVGYGSIFKSDHGATFHIGSAITMPKIP